MDLLFRKIHAIFALSKIWKMIRPYAHLSRALPTITSCWLLVGCTYDYIEPSDVKNPYLETEGLKNVWALDFIQRLQKDQKAAQTYYEVLKPYAPFYEHTSLHMTTLHGLCFIIPFGEITEQTVTGAVYYSVAYNQLSDGKIILKDSLRYPVYVNGEMLHNRIDFSQRFLYSHFFKGLQSDGLVVDTMLTSYMFLLNKTVPYKREDAKNDRKSIIKKTKRKNKALNNAPAAMELSISYDYHYIGNQSGCWGISPQTMIEYAKEAFFSMGYTPQTCLFEYYNDHSIKITIPMPLESESYYRFFAFRYVGIIEQIGLRNNSSLTIQYYFEVKDKNGNIIEGATSDNNYRGGGGGASGSGTGGISGETSGSNNPLSIEAKESYDTVEVLCDSIRNNTEIRQYTSNLRNIFANTVSYSRGTTVFYSHNDYVHIVDSQKNIEHAVSLEHFDNNIYTLSNLNNGNERNASVITNSTTVAHVHNHPNNSAPSPQDLLLMAASGADDANLKYEAEIIFNPESNDTTVYIMRYTNKANYKTLYEGIVNEIDDKTNDFKENGECDKLLEKFKYIYNNLPENEKMIFRLQIIANCYSKERFQICKISWNKNKEILTTYDFTRDTTPGRKNQIKPIKCE